MFLTAVGAHHTLGALSKRFSPTPYLGVTLSTYLKFNIHKNVAKSHQCLAFVRRILKYCPEKLRRLSYISLKRSQLEYSSSVWVGPNLRMDIHQLEMVQRWAACFIKPDYSYDSSVSQVLKDLDLSSLENRRKMTKLTLLYKIRNNLICIKENGYLERADSRTRDASRNYKLKSDKIAIKALVVINTPKIWYNVPSVIKDRVYAYTILRTIQDSSNTPFSIVMVMSHQIGSRTPWRGNYAGFCLYNKEE